MVTTALILAGGLGTRLRNVVSDVPKPMAPINGKPFLAHQLAYWRAQGISKFILSVGYKHDVIISYFQNSYLGAEIEYVIELEPLGTGGAFLFAMDKLKIKVPFLLLNGDTYFDIDLKKLTQFAAEKDADWCFSLFSSSDAVRYMGMNVAPDGEILSFLPSQSSMNESRLVNGGVYLVNPRILGSFKHLIGKNQSLETELFLYGKVLQQRFFGMEFSGSFIDIGIPEDYYRSGAFVT